MKHRFNSGVRNKRRIKPVLTAIAGITAAIFASWASALSNAVEGYEGTTVVFQISKPRFSASSETFDQRVKYTYQAKSGSATEGEDFNVVGGNSGKIIFAKGQNANAQLTVVLDDDGIDEGSETYQLVLTEPLYEAGPAGNMWLYGFYLPTQLEFDGVILEND